MPNKHYSEAEKKNILDRHTYGEHHRPKGPVAAFPQQIAGADDDHKRKHNKSDMKQPISLRPILHRPMGCYDEFLKILHNYPPLLVFLQRFR